MLIDQIKADLLLARKERTDTRLTSLLITLISDAERVGKDAGGRAPTDEEVQTTIKKFQKGMREMIEHGKGVTKQTAEYELECLSKYTPKMLSTEELTQFITNYAVTSPNGSIGNIMKLLRDTFGSTFDAKVAKDIFTQLTVPQL